MALSGSNGTFRLDLPGSNSSSGEIFVYKVEYSQEIDQEASVLRCVAECDIHWEQEVAGTGMIRLNRTAEGVVYDLGWRIVSEDAATRVGTYRWDSLPTEIVDLSDNRTVYQWAPSTGSLEPQLGRNSQPFEIHIIDWDYASGSPLQITDPYIHVVPSKPGLSIGAKVGIAVGVAVAVLTILACFFLFRWRRKRRVVAPKWPPADAHEIGVDNPSNKSELPGAGGDAHDTGLDNPPSKPELAVADGDTYEVEHHNKPELAAPAASHEKHTPRSLLAESDSQQSTSAHTQEHLLPKYTVDTPQLTPVGATHAHDGDDSRGSAQIISPLLKTTDVNALKAQEREIAHQQEVSDSLRQLRAEQAALQDRIRLAELREREMGKDGN